jgi:putative endonuclease
MNRYNLHCQGRGARYTKGKDLILKYHEKYDSRAKAMQREIAIKKMTQKQKKELIRNGND